MSDLMIFNIPFVSSYNFFFFYAMNYYISEKNRKKRITNNILISTISYEL